ncbi:MAG: T9SS type A sorting domain-containing protein [Prolixibacteraceae bacterium]
MGFVSGIAIHPLSKDIYIRTDVGGAYRFEKSQEQWLPVTDGKMDNYNVEALALNRSNANEIYVVVGNKELGKLYKSSNKGDNWEQIIGFSLYVDGNGYWRNDDPRLSIDPNNGGKIMYFASRRDGLWTSNDSGVHWSQISTDKIPAGDENSGGQAFVVFDRTSGNATSGSSVIYVGVAGLGIYKTVDSGNTWMLLGGGPDINFKPVCGKVSADGSLYVTYSNASVNNKWDNGGDGRIYKFSSLGLGSNITPANYYGMNFAGIAVSDSDPNKVVTFEWKFGQNNGIHYSLDGGKSWSPRKYSNNKVTKPSWYDETNSTWTFAGGIAFDPENENKIWLTTGFGVMTMEDVRQNDPFFVYRMKGLEELVVMQVFSVPAPNSQKLYAAVADVRGFAISDPDKVPSSCFDNGAFGMTSSMDYCVADPEYLVRVGDNEQYFQSKGFGYVTSNGGQSWNPFASVPQNAANGNIAISASNIRNWVWAPINYSGCGWNVLPHYSEDSGNSWFKCSGVPDGNNDCTEEWSASRFLVADRVNGSKFYYYSYKSGENAKFYRSLDAGKSFNQLLNIQLPSNYKVKMEAIPGKEGHLLMCTRNGSDLMKTQDSGTTWNRIASVDKCFTFGFGKPVGGSANPSIFMKGIVNGVDGLFFSMDAGATWEQISDGNVPGGCLDITGDAKVAYSFYIATGGRGILYYTSSAITSVNTLDQGILEKNLSLNVYPNPSDGHFNVLINCKNQDFARIYFYNMAGLLICVDNFSLVSGENNYSLPLTEKYLPCGIYILRIHTGKNDYFEKIFITGSQ